MNRDLCDFINGICDAIKVNENCFDDNDSVIDGKHFVIYLESCSYKVVQVNILANESLNTAKMNYLLWIILNLVGNEMKKIEIIFYM